MYTSTHVRHVPHGSDGPDTHLGHYRYDSVITTRDCVLSLSDYPDNRYYVPTEKLIKDNFERIIDVTGIMPLRVFNDDKQDIELTYEIIKNILLMTQDRQICYDTTGRWWSQFSTIWSMYSELSRQHLIQIYKGIYRDSDSESKTIGNNNGSSKSVNTNESSTDNSNDSRGENGSVSANVSNGDTRNAESTLPQDRVSTIMTPGNDNIPYADRVSINRRLTEGTNTSDAESHNWGWSISESNSKQIQQSVNSNNSTSSTHNVGMSKGVFNIYDEWVRSYRDTTGGMYYHMQRAPLWSIFI